MRGLRRVIPYRLSFLVFVCIRFVPVFFRELEEIMAAQRLRGARLSPREQLDPRNWPDMFHCLVLPLIVRALKTADEVSRSAEARAFGLRPDRTFLDTTTLSPSCNPVAVPRVRGGKEHPELPSGPVAVR